MTLWRRSKSLWSPSRANSRGVEESRSRRVGRLRQIAYVAGALAAVIASGMAFAATDVPRYAQRRVYGMKPGPRMVIIALPYVSWQDLRRADAPNFHKLIEGGSIGLMQVADGESKDQTRTWVTLGAGAAAAGDPGIGPAKRLPDGGLQADIASIFVANERGRTKAHPGLLGSRLHEFGLKTAVIDTKSVSDATSLGAAVLMDRAGRVDEWALVPYHRAFGHAEPGADVQALKLAVRDALSRCDVALLDLCYVSGPETLDPGWTTSRSDRVMSLTTADNIIGSVLAALGGQDTLIAVVCPRSPDYPNPVTQKSLGPLLLYDTQHPQRGLLYTSRTRWPGFVTAADFAPTVLQWWGIAAGDDMDGQPLTVRPGTPEDIDRLDRTLSDHFRWSFTVVPVHMAYGAVLIVVALFVIFRRKQWRPHLQVPALALVLFPIGYLLSHVAGMATLGSFLAVGLALTFALAFAASRLRSDELALSVALLAGAAVIAADTLTGNWLVRTAAYTPPPMIGARFYGLSNEHMGFLAGMATMGLAALWEWRPWLTRMVTGVSVIVILLISAPFWGANWGGGIAATTALLSLWLLAEPRSWPRALPTAVLLLLGAALLPGMLDVAISPSPHDRTHLGAAAAALFSGHGETLGAIAHRKLHASLGILLYTPWTIVLGIATFGAFWVLLRPGGPVRVALRGRRKLGAGITAALIGGVVSSVVNDSGVVAGAGLFCTALAASLFLVARSEDPA